MEEPKEGRSRSANDRFKSGSRVRVAISTMIAVGLHAAAFVFSPWWNAEPLAHDPAQPTYMDWAWMSASLGESSSGRIAPPSAPAAGETEQEDTEAGPEERSRGDDGTGLDALEQGLRERILRRASPSPTLAELEEAEPEPEIERLEEDRVDARDEAATTIDAQAGTTDALSALESGDLDLDRLSALQPDLALVTPSAWVLIRNPTEVEAFLRRTYRTGALDPAVTGSVGITLWIDERGSVEWAEISRSSGRSDLDEVALELFNEVVAFRPARERGVTVSRSVTFSVTFPW